MKESLYFEANVGRVVPQHVCEHAFTACKCVCMIYSLLLSTVLNCDILR